LKPGSPAPVARPRSKRPRHNHHVQKIHDRRGAGHHQIRHLPPRREGMRVVRLQMHQLRRYRRDHINLWGMASRARRRPCIPVVLTYRSAPDLQSLISVAMKGTVLQWITPVGSKTTKYTRSASNVVVWANPGINRKFRCLFQLLV
jgi:hypothetical protein